MDNKPACSVEWCERVAYARGLCNGHYLRDRQGRDMNKPFASRDRGQVCDVAGCGLRREAWGYCVKHLRMHETYGDALRTPRPGNHGTPGCRTGELSPKWIADDDLSYIIAHRRIKRVRGRATDHPCASCGAERADQWAYQHGSPDERSDVYQGRVVKYSVNVDHYAPFCHGCHRTYDGERCRAERRAKNGIL